MALTTAESALKLLISPFLACNAGVVKLVHEMSPLSASRRLLTDSYRSLFVA